MSLMVYENSFQNIKFILFCAKLQLFLKIQITHDRQCKLRRELLYLGLQ